MSAKSFSRLALLGLSLVLFCLSGATVCPLYGAEDASVDFLSDDFYEDEPETIEVGDPLEPMNRAIFSFNDLTYTWVFDPVARGYAGVLPEDVRNSVWYFFNNLQEPVRFINALLQGRFRDAGRLLARFLVNSTIGVFGLTDPAAQELELPPIEASLGETLATWGIGDGFYLVVPFFGSSTLRDFSGTVVDGLMLTPYYTWADSFEEIATIYVGKEVNKASLHLGEYEELKKLTFDPYIALRNGYFQYRKKLRDHGPDEE